MKLLTEFIERPLRLVKKSLFSLEYDLVAGEDKLANFSYRIVCGMYGLVNGFDKRNIEFYKPRFWTRQINIREVGREIPFAHYNREFTSRTGYIYLPHGEKLTIHFGFFDFNTEVRDNKNNTLISMKRPYVFSKDVNVNIKTKSALLDENPWVVFLTLYLLIRRRHRRR